MLECAGVGAVAGSMVVLMMGGVRLWRGEPLGWSGGLILLGGAVMGWVWGLLRSPSLLQALMRADRQLQLHDLLSSAWEMRNEKNEWAKALVQSANEQSRHVAPRRVVLRWLGARAWGGIMSALLLAGSLLVFAGRLPVTVAGSGFVTPDRLNQLMAARRAVAPGQAAAAELNQPFWLDRQVDSAGKRDRPDQPTQNQQTTRLDRAQESDAATTDAAWRAGVSDASDAASDAISQTTLTQGRRPELKEMGRFDQPSAKATDAHPLDQASGSGDGVADQHATDDRGVEPRADQVNGSVASPALGNDNQRVAHQGSGGQGPTGQNQQAEAMKALPAAPAKYRALIRAYFSPAATTEQ